MTKSELKTGHIVTLANGDEYLVLKDVDENCNYYHSHEILVSYDGTWMSLSEHNEDMTYPKKEYTEFDIIKVERVTHPCCILHGQRRILIWERKPPKKQYTYAQLKEILGEEFEIVKEN